MILCAAIKFTYKGQEIILPHVRHGYAYETLRKIFGENIPVCGIIEGFVTTDNRFLTRKEAFIEARTNHQICQTAIWYADDNNIDELYSEDLY